MKKFLTILILLATIGVSNAQKTKVTDTLMLSVITKSNQLRFEDEIYLLRDIGWSLRSADKDTLNGKEIYIWKFYKKLSYRKRKDEL